MFLLTLNSSTDIKVVTPVENGYLDFTIANNPGLDILEMVEVTCEADPGPAILEIVKVTCEAAPGLKILETVKVTCEGDPGPASPEPEV
jgi:hypothetical protein